MGVAVVQRAAVVGADDEETHRLRVVFGQYLTDGEEVAQRLGHLLVVHAHKTVVHPDLGQGLAMCALALGDFVFMVGKLQVGPATVDIKGFAQHLAAHG